MHRSEYSNKSEVIDSYLTEKKTIRNQRIKIRNYKYQRKKLNFCHRKNFIVNFK